MNNYEEMGKLQAMMKIAYDILEKADLEENMYEKFKYNAWKQQVEEYAKEVGYDLK